MLGCGMILGGAKFFGQIYEARGANIGAYKKESIPKKANFFSRPFIILAIISKNLTFLF